MNAPTNIQRTSPCRRRSAWLAGVIAVGLAILVAALLVLVSQQSTAAQTEQTPAFIAKWGSRGTGDGQFNPYPSDVAMDSSGNVYVSDTGNSRIQKFDSNGNFITKWGSYGQGDGQFATPDGVTTDSSGNVYVADSGNHRIQKFDSSGNFVTKWGTWGTSDGEFDRLYDVAADAFGNVYATEAQISGAMVVGSRIQKFDSSGNFITKWGSLGSGDGQLSVPEDVTTDSSGNVYVSEFGNNRIQKFDSSGNFVAKWGSYGQEDGQFAAPDGVATNSSGSVFYVVDSNNYRIQKFGYDTIAPTTTASAKTADDNTYISGEWTNQDVTLTLTADDGQSGLGVEGIYYNTDRSTNYQEYTAPLSLTDEGTTTISYYATDKAGNQGEAKTFTVKIDKTAPSAPTASFLGATTTTTVSVAASQPWTDTGIDLAAGSPVSITAEGTIYIAYSDPGKTPDGDQNVMPADVPQFTWVAPDAHCWSLVGRIDDGAPFEVGSSKTLSVPTSGRLYLGVNDGIDTFGDNDGSWTAHISSGSPVSPAYTDTSGVKWFKQPVTVRYGGSDDGSGSGVASYTADQVFSSDGTHNYSGTATDKAGNESGATTGTIGIDGSAPDTTANAGGYNSGEWTNQNVMLTLTASDEGGSGVDRIFYNTDGSTTYQEYTAPLSVTSEGTKTVSY